MNKYISVLLICVVLGAAALVTVLHGDDAPATVGQRGTPATPPADATASGGASATPSVSTSLGVASTGTTGNTVAALDPKKTVQTTPPASSSGAATAPAQPPAAKVSPILTPDQDEDDLPPSAHINGNAPVVDIPVPDKQPASSNNTTPSEPRASSRATTTPPVQTHPAAQTPPASTKSAAATPPAVTPPATPQTPVAPAEEKLPDIVVTATHGSGTMNDLSLHFQGNAMYLTLEGSGPMPLRFFSLPNPNRLVIDLPGSWKGLKPPVIPSNQLVKSARIGRYKDADRIVLDLTRPLKDSQSKRYSQEKVEIHFE